MSMETLSPIEQVEYPKIVILDQVPVYSDGQHVAADNGQICYRSDIHMTPEERESFMKYLEFST